MKLYQPSRNQGPAVFHSPEEKHSVNCLVTNESNFQPKSSKEALRLIIQGGKKEKGKKITEGMTSHFLESSLKVYA